MERFYFKTALCHHTAGNRRVDTAREKKKSPARGSDGKSACTRLLPCSYVCVLVTHLNADYNVGVLNVDLNSANGREDSAANLRGYLG